MGLIIANTHRDPLIFVDTEMAHVEWRIGPDCLPQFVDQEYPVAHPVTGEKIGTLRGLRRNHKLGRANRVMVEMPTRYNVARLSEAVRRGVA